ncbi:hypothetical protein [Nocardia sp. CA-119907]|uniref:hypothetical protein n=1 Tax=Nocardia sp. CA-119907 TaxID=3239973 RepID=UPI003D969C52
MNNGQVVVIGTLDTGTTVSSRPSIYYDLARSSTSDAASEARRPACESDMAASVDNPR